MDILFRKPYVKIHESLIGEERFEILHALHCCLHNRSDQRVSSQALHAQLRGKYTVFQIESFLKELMQLKAVQWGLHQQVARGYSYNAVHYKLTSSALQAMQADHHLLQA